MRSEVWNGYSVREDGQIVGKRGTAISPSDNGRGYLIVGVMLDGKRVTKAVHRLVAEVFVANPLGLPEVNHRDGNKRNNHWTNLEWCSRGENIAHAYAQSLRSATGTSNARCLHEEAQIREICELLSQGHKASVIKDMGHPYSLVRKIKSRENWTHISDHYSW